MPGAHRIGDIETGTTYELKLSDGHQQTWVIPVEGGRAIGNRGTYTVFRDRIEFHDPGGITTARWSLGRSELR